MIERIVIVSFSLYQKSVQVLLLFPQEKISEDEDFEKDINGPLLLHDVSCELPLLRLCMDVFSSLLFPQLSEA
mgnify:CR=1 FL=1